MEKDNEYDTLGGQYVCKLYINKLRVPIKNIQNIVIREWVFDKICSLDMTILDSGIFTEISPLFDESPISIEIAKSDRSETLIMEFDCNNYETERLPIDSGDVYAIRIVAIQKTNNFFYPQYSRYFENMTSSQVVEQIASENLGMTFDGSVESDDAQNWFQIALTNYDMLKHLSKRAYIQQEDLPMIYMDRNKSLNYTSIKTACKAPAKFNAYCDDVMFSDDGNDPIIVEKLKKYKENSNIECLFFKTTITTKNIASLNNKDMGYGIDMTYFDHENFYRYVMNFNFAPLTKYSNVNKNNYNKLTQSITFNTIHKNTHSNYMVANLQNQYINNLFFNSYLQIIINPNSKVKLMDVINVEIPDIINSKLTGKKEIDRVNSGLYLVCGIMQDIQKDGNYSMVLTLIRNGVNKPDYKFDVFDMIEVKK